MRPANVCDAAGRHAVLVLRGPGLFTYVVVLRNNNNNSTSTTVHAADRRRDTVPGAGLIEFSRNQNLNLPPGRHISNVPVRGIQQ